MNLKNLDLDPFLLAKIYPQPITSPGADHPFHPPEKIRYLGENKKRILIFFQNDFSEIPDENSFQLLNKILQACNLVMADIALVNFSQQAANGYQEISLQFKPKKVLFFGILPNQMGLLQEFPPYLPQVVEGVTFLVADGLAELQAQTHLKQQLWKALKPMFKS